MALSDYERQVLSQMEAELREEDPKLASVLTSSLPEVHEARSGKLSARNIALGAIVAIAGLAIIVMGVSINGIGWSIVLGIVGFVFMVGGVMWALRPVKTTGKGTKQEKTKKSHPASKGGESKSFMDKQRERWDKRRDHGTS